MDEQGAAVIPEGTREICDMAFQENPQLIRVVLPDSVRKVGSRAFAGCENLREVHLNDGLEILEEKAAQGVEVRLIYDDMGCMFTLPRDYNEQMAARGIQCRASGRLCMTGPERSCITIPHKHRSHFLPFHRE